MGRVSLSCSLANWFLFFSLECIQSVLKYAWDMHFGDLLFLKKRLVFFIYSNINLGMYTDLILNWSIHSIFLLLDILADSLLKQGSSGVSVSQNNNYGRFGRMDAVLGWPVMKHAFS